MELERQAHIARTRGQKHGTSTSTSTSSSSTSSSSSSSSISTDDDDDDDDQNTWRYTLRNATLLCLTLTHHAPHHAGWRRDCIRMLWLGQCYTSAVYREQLQHLHRIRRSPRTNVHQLPTSELGRSFQFTARYKIQHDIDQLQAILAQSNIISLPPPPTTTTSSSTSTSTTLGEDGGGGGVVGGWQNDVAVNCTLDPVPSPDCHYAQYIIPYPQRRHILSMVLRRYQQALNLLQGWGESEMFTVTGPGALQSAARVLTLPRTLLSPTDHYRDGRPKETEEDYSVFNRVWYIHQARLPWHIESPVTTLSPQFNAPAIRDAYQARDPGVSFGDHLLSHEALADLRDFCIYSTIWHETKPYGYLGTYWQDGFTSPLLQRIVRDLRQAFPSILGPHPLTNMWAYKYIANQTQGVGIHADAAAVNVNFWITPDHYNQQGEGTGRSGGGSGGGLTIWTSRAHKDASFTDYNAQPEKARELLRNVPAIHVPYRANRVMIFHSDLYHKTEPPRFTRSLKGYRINITLLFGFRQAGTASSSSSSSKRNGGGRGGKREAESEDEDDDVLL